MAGIWTFPIYRADASIDDNSMTLRLWYPNLSEIQPITDRIKADPEWGCRVFDNLLTKGYSTVADEDHPVPPPSAGQLWIFDDDVALIHRRDAGARVHPMYHSAAAGFPDNLDGVASADGLRKTGQREACEEQMLISRYGKALELSVPDFHGCQQYVNDTVRNLWIDPNIPRKTVPVDTVFSRDELIVFDHTGRQLFCLPTNVEFSFEASTCVDVMDVIRFLL